MKKKTYKERPINNRKMFKQIEVTNSEKSTHVLKIDVLIFV